MQSLPDFLINGAGRVILGPELGLPDFLFRFLCFGWILQRQQLPIDVSALDLLVIVVGLVPVRALSKKTAQPKRQMGNGIFLDRKRNLEYREAPARIAQGAEAFAETTGSRENVNDGYHQLSRFEAF